MPERASADLHKDAGATPIIDAAPIAAPPELVEVTGEVLDTVGKAVRAVNVFAVEKGAAWVVAWARSGSDGRFRLRVPSRPHEFVVMSPHWALAGFRSLGQRHIGLTVIPVLDPRSAEQIVRNARGWAFVLVRPRKDPAPGASASGAVITHGPSVGLLAGRVTDESGVPLGGVAVVALGHRTRKPISVTVTDKNGQYTLVSLAGPSWIGPLSPGLKLGSAKRSAAGGLDLELTIDARSETVSIQAGRGRALTFRMSDSIWPEYMPPPQVKVLLKTDYNIDTDDGSFCPGDLLIDGKPAPWVELLDDAAMPRNPALRKEAQDLKRRRGCPASRCPASVWQRQCKIPKYWWLRMIREAPPNPAREDPTWWVSIIAEMQAAEAHPAAR